MPLSLPLLPIALFMVLVPVALVGSGELGNHDASRLAQLALGSVCTAMLAWQAWRAPRGGHQGQRLGHRNAMAVLCALLMGAWSVWGAAQPPDALREVALLAGLAAVAAVVSRTRQPAAMLLPAAVIAASLYALLLTGLLLSVLLMGGRIDHDEFFIGYDNRRFFNHVQTACLPLCLAVVLDRQAGRLLRGAAWFAVVAGVALLCFSAGRATALGLLAGLAAAAWVVRRRACPLVRTAAAAVALGLMLYGVLFVVLPALAGVEVVSDIRVDRSASGRPMLWRLAAAHAAASPWHGIGPMHFSLQANSWAAYPHNTYLQVAAEWGLPIFVGLLILAGIGLRRLAACTRLAPAPAQPLGACLLAACVALAVDAGFSGTLVMPVAQVWAAVTIGMTFAFTRARGCAGARCNPAMRSSAGVALLRGAVMALLVLQLWLWADLHAELLDLNAHLVRTLEQVGATTRSPRFWSDGWIAARH